MALVHSPSIVTNGLIFGIDAVNSKSYPGSGTDWYDLTKNYDAILKDGATISGDGVSLAYSASSYEPGNDYVEVQTTELNTLLAPWTMTCWFNLASSGYDTASQSLALMGCSGTSPTGFGKMIGIGGGSRERKPWGLLYDSTGAQKQVGNFSTVGSQIPFDTWHMMTMTHDNTTAKIYLNDTLDSSTSCSGYTPYASDTTQKFTIGLNRIFFHFGGLIAMAHVYNRDLSESEIAQNFNAFRGRFNV